MTITRRHRVRRTRRKAEPASVGVVAPAVASDPRPLIGRESELAAIRNQLIEGSGRLVTVTGAGGIGKTQLALAAARDVQPAFPHGVWSVDLAPLRDPGEIDAAIARALRLETVGGHSPAEQVTRYLQNRRLLLILDNFEHLLPAAGRVSEMLADAPGLTVLVTSREPLNLRLEQRLPLRGLGLPDLRAADPESIAQAPAAALFLEHARRLQPDLALTPAAARALAELLHRLDGIPLAIRIAAAHSTILSPAAMLSRLAGQALLSAEGTRDVPVRHHTLHDAIEWSYALLSAAEQAAFLHLAIFVGGWTLEAAEAVIPKHEPAPPAWRILGLLADKSLLQIDAATSDDRRYRMLEPIREYALGRLRQSEGYDAASDRHARYYASLIDQVAAASFGPQEWVWFRRLAVEYENVRVTLRWAIERGDAALGLRLAASLVPFWVWRGSAREGRRWLEEARALGSEAPPLLRGWALAGEGLLAVLLGDLPQAGILLRDALALAEAVRDPALTARVLARLGSLAALQGDASEARGLFERSVAVYPEVADRREACSPLVGLGVCFVLLEDLESAEAAFNDGLDLARRQGSTALLAYALVNLAHLKLRQRDYRGAATLASEMLRVASESRRVLYAVVVIAALVAGHRGDVERALRLLAAVDPWGDLGLVVPLHHDATAVAMLHGRARQQMGEGAYRTAVVEAQTMSVEQVADLAKSCLEPPGARGRDGIAASASSPRSPLSERERAVLHLIGEGLPNKQIATALSIAERTVKKHVSSAMNKLGVDNRAHAVVAAIQRGLL